MQELIEILNGTVYADYLLVLIAVAYGITHLLPHIPPKYTDKIPKSLINILNSLAANYRYTKNRDSSDE